MTEAEQKIGVLEENVYSSLIYYRLKKDLELNDALLKGNEPVDDKGENGLKKLWNKSVINPIRRTKSDKISGERKKITDEIDKFEQKTTGDYTLCRDEEAFERILGEELFPNDTYGMARLVLGIRVALDNSHSFVYGRESLEEVSFLLFKDEELLWQVKKSIEENYYKFAKEQLRNVEYGVMIGLGVASIASWIFTPVYLASVASTSAVATSVLAQVGRSAPGIIAPGIAKITAATIFSSVAFLGINGLGIAVLNATEKKELKKEFRNMSVNDLNLLFAIKATIIQEARKRVPEEILKETIDDCLNWMNDLRSDAEYMLIIERTDAVNAKKKIKSCNLLTERLAEIVGI